MTEGIKATKDTDPYPMCTNHGPVQTICIVPKNFVDTRTYIGSPYAGWRQSIAAGNPRYNTGMNSVIKSKLIAAIHVLDLIIRHAFHSK